MDEMAIMQQCVTKMKEKDMTLNPDTCKFVRKPKSKAPPKAKKPPTEKPKFQPRPIVMQTQKPILKTQQFFEQKQPSGLNAALAEIEPAVKFDRKKYKNTQKFDNPHDDFVLKKLTQAQLGKEQKNYLKTAKLQPTNHPEMQGENFLGNILNDNNLYNQRRWARGPAIVRSSVNLTRAKRAKKLGQPYDLQKIGVSNRIQSKRQQMKEQQLQNQGKTKIQSRRIAEKVKTTSKSKGTANGKVVQEPVAKTNTLLKQVLARKQRAEAKERRREKAEAERIEAERIEAERIEAERMAPIEESNDSDSNLSLSPSYKWQEYAKKLDFQRHMNR